MCSTVLGPAMPAVPSSSGAAVPGEGAAAVAGADSGVVVLVSAEAERYRIPKRIARMSSLVQMLLDDPGA